LAKIREGSAQDVRYVPRGELSAFLAGFLKKDDVLVTMGAGDITKVGPDVLKLLKLHE
jgi:UDP-N-acetylmuramate-alanine ligase